MDELICLLYGHNWLPNSMPFNLFWTIRIIDSYSYGWSINAFTTFCSSTCLAMPTLMWKGTKGQSMTTCPSSQNAHTLKSNLVISESTYSWSLVSTMYFIWSNSRFFWCEYDYGTSSNTFNYASAYSNGFR